MALESIWLKRARRGSRLSRRLPLRDLGGERLRLDRVELGLADRARVEEALRLLDLASRAATSRDGLHVLVHLRLLSLCLFYAPLGHPLVLHDQVDEDADERDDDDEDDPEHLREARGVVAAEDVREDGDQEPEPDHPREEDEHVQEEAVVR